MTAPEADARPVKLERGAVLASRYRITDELGAGGMGIVYGADHLELRTRVAVKLLQPNLAEDATARARFLREARLAASIEGDHSARIHDVGTDERGRPYMVMEHLSGETASARLAREGRLPVVDAATLMLQVLDVLAEAHAKGLVHRDLKPANLFLVNKPGEPVWVKVLDFGISKVAGAADGLETRASTTLTGPRTMLGSPEYMSPEQLRDSSSVDTRSDIWACGVILFELLSGKMPFKGASLPDLYARIVAHEPHTLSGTVDAVPGPVSRMIERCLRKDPAQRPQTAYELAVGLAPYATDSARALLPRIRAWCKSDAPLPEGPRSRRVVVGGLSLVAVAGVLAFAAASVTAPAGPPVAASRSTAVVRPLDPVATAAPAPSGPVAPEAATSASSSSSNSSAGVRAARPQSPPPSAKDRPSRPAPATSASSKASARDLDRIDLIE